MADKTDSEERGATGEEGSTSVVTSSLEGSGHCAVVPMYKAVPMGIKWLGPDLDLRIPPQNWLRGGSPLERYVQKALYSRQSARSYMSSFSMAHSNVHLVDSVDVISDAKNIRNLLEIPWAKDEPISLMVHRVGKTLLIDEFDIHKHLLRKQQHDWIWMKRFYDDLVRREQVSRFPPRAQQTQKKLNERNIFSKFLYYSIMSNEHKSLKHEEGAGLVKSPPRFVDAKQQTGLQMGESDSGVEDPFVNFSTGDGTEGDEKNEFSQQFEWKFEDIRMMIGNDLPIFTDESSCVSLRLRDASSPITVLTGLDYWLDNLMCNVPEIAMCYHAGGFVQRYERLSTSEIPHIKGSEFKPEYVKDIAQNILSFLKSKATKMGHTYWLYKAKDSEIVKLYDLTSLTDKEQGDQNPFRHPLAHLLFRVALKLHRRRNHAKSGIIQELLTTSLALATGARPQIVVTAYLILSELYLNEYNSELSANIYPNEGMDDSETETESDIESDFADKSDDEESLVSEFTQLDVTTLSQAQATPKVKDIVAQFPPICGPVQSRSREALQRISEALILIDKDIDEMAEKIASLKDQPQTSAPSVPIPLPFKSSPSTSLLEEKTLADSVQTDDVDPATQRFRDRQKLMSDTWQRKSKASLLGNAMCAYYELGESCYNLIDFSNAMKYCKLALLCYDAISLLDEQVRADRLHVFCRVVSLCGDIHFNFNQSVRYNNNDFDTYNKLDKLIHDSLLREIPLQNYTQFYMMHMEKGVRIRSAMSCYSHVQSVIVESPAKRWEGLSDSTSQRIASAYNEIASSIIESIAQLCTTCDVATGSAKPQNITAEGIEAAVSKLAIAPESDAEFSLKDKSPPQQAQALLELTEVYTAKALSIFSDLRDYNNIAVVTLNTSKRLRVKIHLGAPPHTLTPEQERLFNQSLEALQNALDILGRRESCPQLWDVILYELSGANYSFALALLDSKFLSNASHDEKLGKRISEMLLKALKLSESSQYDGNGLRLYRCAALHHTLGNLYHTFYMYSQNVGDQQKARHMSSLSNTHYEKSCKIFTAMEDHRNIAAVLMQKAELHLANSSVLAAVVGSAPHHLQLRHLELALETLLDKRVGNYLHFITATKDDEWCEQAKSDTMLLLTDFVKKLRSITFELARTASNHTRASNRKTKNALSTASSHIQRNKDTYRIALSINTAVECPVLGAEVLQAYTSVRSTFYNDK